MLGLGGGDCLFQFGGSVGAAAYPGQRDQAGQLILIQAFEKFPQFLACRIIWQIFEDRFARRVIPIEIVFIIPGFGFYVDLARAENDMRNLIRRYFQPTELYYPETRS